MKANEAPEKLYFLPNGLISFCRNNDEDVEYIRTDAFIWKACEFLKENVSKYTEKVDTIFGTIKVLNSHKLANDLKQVMKDE